MSNFGKNIRDFTYISDVVKGILAALNFDTNQSELINLGSQNPINLTQLVHLMGEELLRKNAPTKIHLVPMQKGDVPLTYANITKAKQLLHWEPEIGIKQGLELFLEWYQTHNASVYMPMTSLRTARTL